MIDIKYMAVRYRLGLLDTESLVRIADNLLEEGRDTPAVIQLSILESPIMSDAATLFERACVELGVSIPSKNEAVGQMLRFHLESIASGTRLPREGLNDIMRELYYPYVSDEPVKEYMGDSRGLEHLIGSYWSYDDLMNRPSTSFRGKRGLAAIPLYDEHVRQLARDWLQKNVS